MSELYNIDMWIQIETMLYDSNVNSSTNKLFEKESVDGLA